MHVVLQTWCQIQRTWSSVRYLNCGPGHIQCNYSSTYSGFNIQLIPPALLLDICRDLDARYTANLVPNTALVIQFTLCDLVVPHRYNVITAPHIQASIFNRRYLRCNWRYHDNSILLILQTWSQIQRTSSSLRYVNCRPGQIQCNYSSAHSGLNIQLNLPALLLEIYRQFNVRYTANIVPNTAHMFQFALSEL
jgi:hypothetical protein